MTVSGDGDDIMIKFSQETEIHTFKSCSITERYVPNGGQFEGRSCEPCPADAPYSGGFAS